jgi:2-methylcitrate dehydratase PrpD
MSIAAELGKRIVAMRYEDLPPEAVEWAKFSFIDTIACAFAAVGEEAPAIAERVLTGGAAGGESLLWGTNRRVGALDAAAINGTAAHALDYDDCNNAIAGHPTVAILPGLLALAERLGASGRDILVAHVAGFEAQAKIAHAVHMHHYEKGWHPTATLGIFGAAAACAHLLGLTAERTATALAIAVSLASGVKANFGTMVKPLHAGECTRNGLYAALLAHEGFTANEQAFEHKQGFFEVYNGHGTYDAARVLASWADPYEILVPGVGLKQYPCCASTHSAIDAMLRLRQEHALRPEQVAHIRSVTHDRALVHTNRPLPQSTLDAKFSVQYCVARALIHGDVGFEHFEGESYRDPDVVKLLGHITAAEHAHKAKGMDDHFECEMHVTTTDGRTLFARVDQPLRGPQNLVPPDRLESKFRDCAGRALRADAISPVLDTLRGFEKLASARDLADLLAASAFASTTKRAAA